MILEVCRGTYAWPNHPPVFKDVSFRFETEAFGGRGGILSILGPNGAGKTTLLKTMLGLLPFSSGHSELNGRRVADWPAREFWQRVGYVPQAKAGGFAPLTLAELVVLGRSARIGPFAVPGRRDWETVDRVMEAVGIAHLRTRRTNEVSGGQLQLAMVARALAVEPELLVLDEPESNLDFRNQMLVLDVIGRLVDRGLSVVVNTHFPAHAVELSDRVLLLPRGEAPIFGPTAQTITEENLTRLFGVRVRIREVPTPEKIVTCVAAVKLNDAL